MDAERGQPGAQRPDGGGDALPTSAGDDARPDARSAGDERRASPRDAAPRCLAAQCPRAYSRCCRVDSACRHARIALPSRAGHACDVGGLASDRLRRRGTGCAATRTRLRRLSSRCSKRFSARKPCLRRRSRRCTQPRPTCAPTYNGCRATGRNGWRRRRIGRIATPSEALKRRSPRSKRCSRRCWPSRMQRNEKCAPVAPDAETVHLSGSQTPPRQSPRSGKAPESFG